MSKTILRILDKIIPLCLAALVFLIPLFFLPLTNDFYDFNKNTLLIAGVGLLLLAWAGKMALAQSVNFRHSFLDLPVLAIALAFVLSTIFDTRYRVDVLAVPGSTGTILALTFLYFLITNSFKKSSITQLLNYSITFSASLLSLLALAQLFGLSQHLSAVDWLKLKTWTPAGNLLAAATFLTVIISLNLSQLIRRWQEYKSRLNFSLLFYSFTLLLCLAGLGAVIYQLLGEAKPTLLPYWAGWQIAIEAIKRFPLWGFGPGNFLNAFTLAKPAELDLTDFWGLRFAFSSSWILELTTTLGLVGLASWLWLSWKLIKRVTILRFNDMASAVYPSILISLLLFLTLPSNFLLLFVFYVLLALFALDLPASEHQEESKALPVIILALILAIILPSLYFSGRFWLADFYFKQSLTALAQNKGLETYNLQIKTIGLNPYRDLYHRAYSQTNLALANSLAGKSNLSDQDKNNISQLIQQTIREGKIAIALDKNSVLNWEYLAGVYRNLINFAQGADQWTISSYQQAIALDPLNPTLRLNLGGVYYGLKRFDDAIRFFQQAADLKPNFANAHYNLAAAYREKKDYVRAAGEMEVALSLVDVNSADWQKAKTELEDLRAKLPANATPSATPTPAAEEKLTIPSPLPSPLITPPLELPEESSPPSSTP